MELTAPPPFPCRSKDNGLAAGRELCDGVGEDDDVGDA